MLWNERSHCNETPEHRNGEQPRSPQLEKARVRGPNAAETKRINTIIFKKVTLCCAGLRFSAHLGTLWFHHSLQQGTPGSFTIPNAKSVSEVCSCCSPFLYQKKKTTGRWASLVLLQTACRIFPSSHCPTSPQPYLKSSCPAWAPKEVSATLILISTTRQPLPGTSQGTGSPGSTCSWWPLMD